MKKGDVVILPRGMTVHLAGLPAELLIDTPVISTTLGEMNKKAVANPQTTQRKKAPRNQPDSLLTMAEAAELLSVHVNTLRRWSDKGMVDTYRIGTRGDRRFRRQAIENLLMSGLHPANKDYR